MFFMLQKYKSMFKDKTILITGGSGSWGRELTRQLLEFKPKEIIIFSRGEISQVAMEREFNDSRITYVIGDIRDAAAVDRVMSRGVDIVYQLAALKHVPICENHPQEAVLTNIKGMGNVIESAINHKVEKFIDVSTDKAVDPINTYGLTKAVGEKLTIQANCRTKDSEFICIRGGNVIGTNGSVIPYIINQIKSTNKVTITDDRMTRFFLTLPQAIQLLFKATEFGVGGETYVMNMPSFYIKDLIELLVDYFGDKDTQIETIGAREGEKLHEVLISDHERPRARYVNDDYWVIYPQLQVCRFPDHIWDYPEMQGPALGSALSSQTNLKDKSVLLQMLLNSGFLKNRG